MEPGVYLMKNAGGRVIYIGKALNLKKRLESYFTRNNKKDIKTTVLLNKIADIDTIITRSEKEALILESTLIKRYKPRYNVILKDDKRYPSLCINTNEPYPYISVKRKIKKDGSTYFGPYTSASALSQTLKLINKTFKLRKCKTRHLRSRTRPCLNHQMQLCLAPCCLHVDEKEYDGIVQEVIMFLKGRTPELLKTIEKNMLKASDEMAFEKAAMLRDKLFALTKVLEKQVVVSTDFIDRDIISLVGTEERSVITVLFVRGGFLVGSQHVLLAGALVSETERAGSFIRQFYIKDRFIPSEILMSVYPDDKELIEDMLTSFKESKVSILVPKRGEKATLVMLAQKNAENVLQDTNETSIALTDKLQRLRKRLGMRNLPERIECFDNSNLSGSSAVAGMVVYKKGEPDKRSYRKYKIRSVKKQDDYACMHEVLHRRFKGGHRNVFPDLLLIDGGKGQLNVAMDVLKKIGIDGEFTVAAIAKKDSGRNETADKVYIPGRSNPVNLGREGDLILLLQQIRDEAHRFAVAFHRTERTRKQTASRLDGIPGIGPKRKKILLTHFKSVRRIKRANVNEISSLPGMSRTSAEILKAHLGA